MEIIDLTEKYYQQYFCCLEDWSEDMKDAGDHKQRWFEQMKEKGLRVKIALIDEKPCGMIQYVPVEHSVIEGEDLYFINCIWVHGHKQGIGNFQKQGIGKAILQAAEADVMSLGKKGIAAWGLSLPIWMKASWFKKRGYRKADQTGMSVLLWKPFQKDALPPRWIKEKKKPEKTDGIVTVTSFVNGWCPAQNIVHERAKRASLEFGESVKFQEIHTSDRSVFLEWGISDALFIDGKMVRTGPPPSLEAIRKFVRKKVKTL
ncbi:MAG: GNAT family N-acetyltransferase [Candidatus Cloacimonetes bacterium]|nr:GNAT family N-acetyltransferase [Candidatus Cloacimonadota bacterium]